MSLTTLPPASRILRRSPAAVRSNTANDSDTDPTTVIQLPDLTIAKSHTGNFTQGQVGATYSITVTNSGLPRRAAVVTVTDTLPAGLTPTADQRSPVGLAVPRTLTCTRSDALAVRRQLSRHHAYRRRLSNAPASVTNTANVSGGGEIKQHEQQRQRPDHH